MISEHIVYEKLVAFAAGDLPKSDSAMVAMHAASCADCAKTIQHFESVSFLMRADDYRMPPTQTIARAQAIFQLAPSVEHIPDETLVAFVEGELDAVYAARVSAHTATCTDCARTVKRFKAIGSLLHSEKMPEPSAAMLAQASSIFAAADATALHYPYEDLVAYAFGELSTHTSIMVAAHVTYCTECSHTIKRVQGMRSLMTPDFGRQPSRTVVAKARAIFNKRRPAQTPSLWEQLGQIFSTPTFGVAARAALIVILLLGNLILLAGVGNVIVLAQDAIPGDSLYSVKLAKENAALEITFDTAGKLLRHLDYAGFRLSEAGMLVQLNRLTEVPSTLDAYQNETQQVVSTFQRLSQENPKLAGDLGSQVKNRLSSYATTLTNLKQSVGETIQPFVDQAIQASSSAVTMVQQVISSQPSTSPTSAPAVSSKTSASAATPTRGLSQPSTQPKTSAGASSSTSSNVSPSTSSSTSSRPGVGTSSSSSSVPPVIASPTATPKPPPTLTPQPTATPKPPSTLTPQPTEQPKPTKIPPGQATKTAEPNQNKGNTSNQGKGN